MDLAGANAGGSIGIIVDIPSNDCVLSVGAHDSGTSYDAASGEALSGGFPANAESCARSIDERTTSNEWYVRDFRTVAIFAFGPISVRHPDGGDAPLNRDVAFRLFPEYRIFSTHNGQFVEFDRDTREWTPVSYDTIMSATPRPTD
jgi:hypothetical protein